MKHKLILLTAAFAFTMGGCDPMGMPGGITPASDPQPTAVADDANYTIMLHTIGGEGHIARAEDFRKRAEKFTRWDGLFVVNKEGHSVLYRGRYRTWDEAAPDLKESKEYISPAKIRVFPRAMIVPLPGGDVGPKEFNVISAPGAYSVLVAVFYDIPDQNYFGRKRRAIELCQKLRDQGVEAWFYHGPSKSGVTIGSFPASAIRSVQVPLIHPQTGDRSFIEKKQIVSEPMKRLMEEYPHLLVCGNVEIRRVPDPKTGQFIKVKQKTYPFSITKLREEQPGNAMPGPWQP